MIADSGLQFNDTLVAINATSNSRLVDMEISPTLLVSFAAALLGLLVAGVMGNVACIASILRPNPTYGSQSPYFNGRRPMSTTQSYIVNLSAADLLFLLFCAPFQGTVYILNHWPYGWFMCKMAHFCQFTTVYSSVWILTTMSIDRYAAIAHPLKSVKWRRSRRAAKVSLAIWIAAALMSSPWLYLYVTTDVQRSTGARAVACYDTWPDQLYQYRKWLVLTVSCVGFLIPALIIFAMAILISKSIQSTFTGLLIKDSAAHLSPNAGTPVSERGSLTSSFSMNLFFRQQVFHQSNSNPVTASIMKRRRRVCWMVFGLAFIFFLFQGPQNVSLLWINFDAAAAKWIGKSHRVFFVLRLIAHMLTYINSVLNPILYGLASGRIRNFLTGSKGLAGKPQRAMRTVPRVGSGIPVRGMELQRPKVRSRNGQSSSSSTSAPEIKNSAERNHEKNEDVQPCPYCSGPVYVRDATAVFGKCDLRMSVLKKSIIRSGSSSGAAFV